MNILYIYIHVIYTRFGILHSWFNSKIPKICPLSADGLGIFPYFLQSVLATWRDPCRQELMSPQNHLQILSHPWDLRVSLDRLLHVAEKGMWKIWKGYEECEVWTISPTKIKKYSYCISMAVCLTNSGKHTALVTASQSFWGYGLLSGYSTSSLDTRELRLRAQAAHEIDVLRLGTTSR